MTNSTVRTRRTSLRRLGVSAATALLALASAAASAAAPTVPGAPVGTVSDNGVSLSWAASADDESVTGYNVYRNGSYLTTVATNQASVAFGSGDTATFAIAAFDSPSDGSARGYSALSAATEFSRTNESASTPATDTSAEPTAPRGLGATRTSNSTVLLTWQASADADGVAGYNVYRDGQYITSVSNPRLGDIGLAAGVSYEYYVVAYDVPRNFSERSVSVTVSATVGDTAQANDPVTPTPADPDEGNDAETDNSGGPDTAAPDAPTNVVATITDANTRISWSPANDDRGVSGYNVYRNDAYITTTGATSYIDTGRASASDAYYVVAFDAVPNFSQRSAEASTDNSTPGATDPDADQDNNPVVDDTDMDDGLDTTAPNAPSSVTVSNADTGNQVSWTAATDNIGVAGYNLYRDDNYLQTVSGLSATDTGSSSTTAEYYVVAFDAVPNFSARSPVATASNTIAADPDDGSNAPGDDSSDDGGTSGDAPPVLDDPSASAVPSPSFSDPFGFELETDTEAPTAGGPPTQPKNLRLDLVSYDWVEFSWAPSNDDGTVVAYEITRNDGVSYRLTPSLPSGLSLDPGTYAEYEKYWATTSFIDCNDTRFALGFGTEKAEDGPWNCSVTGPNPGDDYSYTVAAIDDAGQRSPESEPVQIAFFEEENAPIPLYDDIYLGPNDRFASVNNLSTVPSFIGNFDLVFEEEFDGSDVDSSLWNTSLLWGDSLIINGEQQYFVNTQQSPDFGYNPFNFAGSADNGALDGEGLTIEAIPVPDDLRAELPPVCEEADPTGLDRCEFLSGALSSHDKFSFIYGYVEGRIRASTTSGALSSFYLYHRYIGGNESDQRLRHGPEIDILEYLGENPFGNEDAFQNYHFTDPNTGIIRSSPTMNHAKNPTDPTDVYGGDYHTFGVLWEPQLVIWYIDGVEVRRIFGPQVSRQPMNIVNYLVAGSAWAPTPDVSNPDNFPINMDIDYIRVFQRDAFRGTANFGQ